VRRETRHGRRDGGCAEAEVERCTLGAVRGDQAEGAKGTMEGMDGRGIWLEFGESAGREPRRAGYPHRGGMHVERIELL
jgi:hypothetical protein